MSKISWRVSLLSWYHDPSLIDADWLHLTPTTLLWHHQRKPSEWVESAEHVISWPQVLHSILLRIRPMSFRNWIVIYCSQIRYIKKNRFGAPSSLSTRCPKENFGTYSRLCNRSSYSEVTWSSCSTEKHTAWRQSVLHCGCRMRNALWIWSRETEMTTTATYVGVSEWLEPCYYSVTENGFLQQRANIRNQPRKRIFH